MFVIHDSDGNILFNGGEFNTTDDAWQFVRETLCEDEWGDVYVQPKAGAGVEYELIDHGVDTPDYFQGCGVALTPYSYVVTGIGDNPSEAIEDALEQIIMEGSGVDADALASQILADEGWEKFPTSPSVEYDYEGGGGDRTYYYVSIRYNPQT